MKEAAETGITVEYRPGIHQKFAVIDETIVWYESINLLSYGQSEESMMRFENAAVAGELLEQL